MRTRGGGPFNDRRSGLGCEIEASAFGERSKIAITRQQNDPAIQTALCDQGIAQARLPSPGEHTRPELTRSLPAAMLDLDHGQLQKAL